MNYFFIQEIKTHCTTNSKLYFRNYKYTFRPFIIFLKKTNEFSKRGFTLKKRMNEFTLKVESVSKKFRGKGKRNKSEYIYGNNGPPRHDMITFDYLT